MSDGGDRPARLVLPAPARRELVAGLEEAYPAEGCGVLLGEEDGPDRRVTEVRPAENRWPERGDRGGRYLVDPGTLRRLMDREAAGGPAILGFYHSHPDADPVPSETDRELAWPWYLYLVVPVREGEAGEGRAWQLDAGAGGLRERPVLEPAP
jgi:proteasome lid subunit RPN8/RPN11